MKDKIGRLIKHIDMAFDSEITQTLKKYGITSSQIEVLIYLHRNQDHKINQREIEHSLHRSNPTITGILNRLEKNGFIVRESCNQDARYKYIVSTEKARQFHQEMKQSIDKKEALLLSCLSEDEREELIYLLKKLLNNMR